LKAAKGKASELWDRIPKSFYGNKTVRADIKGTSATDPGSDSWEAREIDSANMITSLIEDGGWTPSDYHKPLLDIDYGAELVPSSTPGHYHLYLDTAVPKDAYFRFLQAAMEAGIIQKGFYDGAVRRGATSVRLPWVKKHDLKANQLNPNKEIEDQIKLLKKQLAELEAQLAVEEIEW